MVHRFVAFDSLYRYGSRTARVSAHDTNRATPLNWKVVKNSFGETARRCCPRRRSPLWIKFKLRRLALLVFNSAIIEAQTFTPDVTGQLSSIDITVRNNGATGNVTLSVYDLTETGVARTPVDALDLLGQTTILASSIPSAERQTLTFNFAALPNLLAGTQYAMVLSAPTRLPIPFCGD